MHWQIEMRSRIYQETASLIMQWYYQKKIDETQMGFLLNLLEEVMVNRAYPELLKKMKQWQNSKTEEAINEIIQATMLAVDFEDADEVEGLIAVIDNCVSEH